MAEQSEDISRAEKAQKFHEQITREFESLKGQIKGLEDISLVGGERSDAVEHCLAGISRLSAEVQDATSFLPAYDQRSYSNTFKSIQEDLERARNTAVPRPKFSFKSASLRKNASAMSLADAATLADQKSPLFPSHADSVTTSANETPLPGTPDNELASKSPIDPLDSGKSEAQSGSSSAEVKSIRISNRQDAHITIPVSASPTPAPAVLSHLNSSIIDIVASMPPTGPVDPTAGILTSLAVKDVKRCALFCGHVEGPAHLTNLTHVIVVLSCRQFRMHECSNVDVYVHCTSHPIVEAVANVRFAPLPDYLQSESLTATHANKWEQVNDFKWLKSTPSPNWSVLPQDERVERDVWSKARQDSETAVGQILRNLGI